MVAIVKPSETHDEAVHRLSAQALKRDLRIYEHEPSGEFYCTSHSQPDIVYRVTLLSCECQGFASHQRCQHHARLLHHLGELPRLEPDPSPPAMPVVLCDQCGEPMKHINGVAFECQCGAGLELNWEVADKIEMAICAADPDAVAAAERLLAPGGDSVPAGVDPDQCPSREDTPYALGLYTYSANELAAVLIWQADRQAIADRFAA